MLNQRDADTILRITEKLSDVDKAGLAAKLLSDTDPTDKVLKEFFDNLDDTVHEELVLRAEEEEDRR